MRLTISSVGLATAQGSSTDILGSDTVRSLQPWPWPVNGWTTSHSCRPSLGVGADLRGLDRWRALAEMALNDCFRDHLPCSKVPIFLGTCNGSADVFEASHWSEAFDSTLLLDDTPWSAWHVPVFSSSCNSGLHALYAAKNVLAAGHADEAVVIAVDILSRSNQDNFEGLRLLTDSTLAPWQPNSNGFVLGEAAVALKLTKTNATQKVPSLTGPVLKNDLSGHDGLRGVLQDLSPINPRLVMGQGTGPPAIDDAELSALAHIVSRNVPLATSLLHFGHTLGASGLLSIALATLMQRTGRSLPTISTPVQCASDGRPLMTSPDVPETIDNVLVSCRALNGSCAAAVVGTAGSAADIREGVWQATADPNPLMHPTLRAIAKAAEQHRPAEPPDVLLVRLEVPLTPPPEAVIGKRLLPSAVLEITPGFVSQLIARCWGFAGPTLCTVGNINDSDGIADLKAACEKLGQRMCRIDLHGMGDEREIKWDS